MVYKNHPNEKAKITGMKGESTKRRCLLCGSDKTNVGSVNIKTGKLYARWHKFLDGWICNTCHFRKRYYEIKEKGNEIWMKVQAH